MVEKVGLGSPTGHGALNLVQVHTSGDDCFLFNPPPPKKKKIFHFLRLSTCTTRGKVICVCVCVMNISRLTICRNLSFAAFHSGSVYIIICAICSSSGVRE